VTRQTRSGAQVRARETVRFEASQFGNGHLSIVRTVGAPQVAGQTGVVVPLLQVPRW
jgi:hypothetical protein